MAEVRQRTESCPSITDRLSWSGAFRVTRSASILGQGRRTEERRVHDRVTRQLQSIVVQMPVHHLEQRFGQPMLLQQMAELAYRHLVRCRLAPEIDLCEPPYRRRIIQSPLHGRIAQRMPSCRKYMRSARSRSTRWRPPSGAYFQIERFNHATQLRPRHDVVLLGQEQSRRVVSWCAPSPPSACVAKVSRFSIVYTPLGKYTLRRRSEIRVPRPCRSGSTSLRFTDA